MLGRFNHQISLFLTYKLLMTPVVSSTKQACSSVESIKPKTFVENDGTGTPKKSWCQPVTRAKVIFLENPPPVSPSGIRPFKKRMLQKSSGW